MKKIYILTTALFLGANINSQVVDFESVTLSLETYDNGSVGSGDFILDGISLTNTYDDAWGVWNGFSISNMTNVDTAGWGNQYSVYTGEGSNGSENFGVYTPEGMISTMSSGTTIITSFDITNTTYSAISMRDGDGFAKQFGSATDANGMDDGTNGEDFFKVWIIGENMDGSQRDSLEFFLADYRFADNGQDYIVNSWETVDLTGFNILVDKVMFRLESSDNGQWGINTPAYFAIDNIATQVTNGLGKNFTVGIEAYPNPVNDVLNVKGANGQLTLTDANGNIISSTTHLHSSVIDMTNLAQGVYFLKLETAVGSAVQNIIK